MKQKEKSGKNQKVTPEDNREELNHNNAPEKTPSMKTIHTGGINYLEPLNCFWMWGMDCTSGDLYEAEELYRNGHRIRQNRLIFVHTLDGRVEEPIKAKEGQYFGKPAFDDGVAVILLADFPAEEIRLLRYNNDLDELSSIVTLPRSEAEDCYNLMVHFSPLMLTRQANNRFQVIWPEKADFPIHPAESFVFREGDSLFFSRWYEDPDYREEVVVRRFPSGEITDQFRGSLNPMSNGQHWLLTE